jgi:hypothetical protein
VADQHRFKGDVHCFQANVLDHVTCGVNDDNAVVVTYCTFLDDSQFAIEDDYFAALGETEDPKDFDYMTDGLTDCVRVFWL